MVTMFIASTEAVQAYNARRKQKRRRDEDDASSLHHGSLRRHDSEEDASEVPHVRQVCDLVAWHIGVEDADGTSNHDLHAGLRSTCSKFTHLTCSMTYYA